MGAQQSARKISIENDEPANVIKISDSLVDRLRGGMHQTSGVEQHNPSSSRPHHSGAMHSDYHYPSFTALQVKKDMEEQLTDNNKYWMRRLEDLELAHKKIDYVMEQEFDKAVENVRDRFKKLPATHNVPPCLEGKARLIQCYKQNADRPIECSNEVKLFTQCVNKERSQLLRNRS